MEEVIQEVVKQKKDKTELVKKLSLSNGVIAFAAILFSALGLLSYGFDWEIGRFDVFIVFAIIGAIAALAAMAIAIVLGIFFLKFQVNLPKLKNKTAAILNIVLSGSILVVAIIALLLGSFVEDDLLVYGIILMLVIGAALCVIDILIFVFIYKNKNPKV